MCLVNLARDVKSESEVAVGVTPATVIRAAFERFKDLFQRLLLDGWAAVCDLDTKLRFLAHQAHSHRRVGRRPVLDGVLDEIAEQLLQP